MSTFMGGPSREWYGGKATLPVGAQGYQHSNISITRLEQLTYIFVFTSSLSPCSLAVTLSKGFCLQCRRLGGYSVSYKLEVKKKRKQRVVKKFHK